MLIHVYRVYEDYAEQAVTILAEDRKEAEGIGGICFDCPPEYVICRYVQGIELTPKSSALFEEGNFLMDEFDDHCRTTFWGRFSLK